MNLFIDLCQHSSTSVLHDIYGQTTEKLSLDDGTKEWLKYIHSIVLGDKNGILYLDHSVKHNSSFLIFFLFSIVTKFSTLSKKHNIKAHIYYINPGQMAISKWTP